MPSGQARRFLPRSDTKLTGMLKSGNFSRAKQWFDICHQLDSEAIGKSVRVQPRSLGSRAWQHSVIGDRSSHDKQASNRVRARLGTDRSRDPSVSRHPRFCSRLQSSQLPPERAEKIACPPSTKPKELKFETSSCRFFASEVKRARDYRDELNVPRSSYLCRYLSRGAHVYMHKTL